MAHNEDNPKHHLDNLENQSINGGQILGGIGFSSNLNGGGISVISSTPDIFNQNLGDLQVVDLGNPSNVASDISATAKFYGNEGTRTIDI